MRTIEAYGSLSGVEKVAILLMAIGEEHAAKLIKEMENDEIKEISQTMAGLGKVSAALVERLFVDFLNEVASIGSLVGNYESTERLLSKTLSEDRVKLIMEEIRGPAGRTMWEKLANVDEEILANYFKNEYPQTVAVVMSKIKPEHAARVISALPDNFALEVIQRMLSMESVQKEILDDVERTLRTEFMSNLARTNRADAHEMMAEIFNNLDRTNEAKFMGFLEEKNEESAEKIKELMFTFEDLIKLDAGGIQMLLRNVERERLSLALKGASEDLRDIFFKNMSERAAKILKEDMEAQGPVRLRDVDKAQIEMVVEAKRLAASGDIIISDNKGDDELVY